MKIHFTLHTKHHANLFSLLIVLKSSATLFFSLAVITLWWRSCLHSFFGHVNNIYFHLEMTELFWECSHSNVCKKNTFVSYRLRHYSEYTRFTSSDQQNANSKKSEMIKSFWKLFSSTKKRGKKAGKITLIVHEIVVTANVE